MQWPRKFIWVLFLGAIVGVAAVSAHAAETTAPKQINFAVVDMQTVLREAAATKMIRSQLDKLKQTYQDKFKKYEEKLRAENQDLQRQRTILSPEAFADRQKAFKNRVNGMQREVQTVRRMLDQAGSVALGNVHQTFRDVTADLAKERSLQLVVRKSGLLFVDPAYDMTTEILKRLDKRLPEVTVELPQPSGGGADNEPRKN